LRIFRQHDAQAAPKPIPNLVEFAEKWKAELEKRVRILSTRRSYGSNLKHHVLRALGDRLVTEIDYPALWEFVCRKVNQMTAESQRRC
jgi:hypothetical protein